MGDLPEGFARETGPGGLETRLGSVPVTIETRADDDGAKRIVGYASVFDTPTRIGGLFSDWDEEVAKGAWTKTLKESKRILSMFNHDTGRVLGSTEAGSARFSEDDTGLRYEVDVNTDDPLAMSAFAQVDRGEVRGASVWFRVVRQEWTYPSDDNGLDVRKRRILEAQLFEGGPVVFPAFDATTAGTRSLRAIDVALRAADAPDDLRAQLAADALADPDKFEHDLRALLDRTPQLRDAVCACSHTSSSPDGEGEDRAAPDGAPGHGTPPAAGHLPADIYLARARGWAARLGTDPKDINP